MKKVGHWISGEIHHGQAERLSPIYNPAMGEVIAECEHATDKVIATAVERAHAAFAAWSQTPIAKRVQCLQTFQQLFAQHQDALVQLISLEHGKTHQDALGEVQRGLEVVEFACGMPHLLKGEYLPNVGTGVDCFSMRQPLGVCLGITPFNFPAMVPMWMFPLALACGNTFILKPSEKVPSASLLLARLLHLAGVPKDVFQVIQGGRETVEALLSYDQIKAVSFVGSTPAAQSVYETATRLGKRVQALGGAKNHAVVLPDADVNQAVDGIMGAAFGSAGQRCMAISIVVAVGDTLANRLVQSLSQKARSLKVGPASAVSSEMGPVHDAAHLNRITEAIEGAEAEGAHIVYDGRSHNLPNGPGFFIGPTVLDHLTVEMKAYQQEIFGPVLGIIRVKSFEQALDLINQHAFGNGTALFTRDGQMAREFSQRVQAGMVGINVPIPVPVSYFSFGGWKQSLFGDLHVYGPEGVHFYTRYKVVTSRWPKDEKSSPDYKMPVIR